MKKFMLLVVKHPYRTLWILCGIGLLIGILNPASYYHPQVMSGDVSQLVSATLTLSIILTVSLWVVIKMVKGIRNVVKPPEKDE